MKKILTKKGFTLIELIVVIAILAVLAAILIPSLTGYLSRAEYSKNQANARSHYSLTALELSLGKAQPADPDGFTCDAVTLETLDDFSCTHTDTSKEFSFLNNFQPTP